MKADQVGMPKIDQRAKFTLETIEIDARPLVQNLDCHLPVELAIVNQIRAARASRAKQANDAKP